MVTRIGGMRRKTRGIMKKAYGRRGKVPLRHFLQEFALGTSVALVFEPSIQHGIYFRRFYGKVGVVDRKQGECYVVKVRDGDKTKEIIAHPVHLRQV